MTAESPASPASTGSPSADLPAWQGEIDALVADLVRAAEAAADAAALRELEVEALGKKGSVTALMKRVGTLPGPERRDYGAAAGAARSSVEAAIAARSTAIAATALAAELADRSFDETLPGAPPPAGAIHPLALVQRDLEDVFSSMGFHVLDYPEVDSEFSNFEALNIPSWHPARDMQDTFWLQPAGEGATAHLLRTHTSAGQVRTMHALTPPFRAVFPGRVFRYEAVDASHEHTFHQVEGLMIDRAPPEGPGVSVGHLLDAMRTLLSAIFGEEVKVRLRPGYFPFVEPGFELDISCRVCGGDGCSVCKQSGWLELLPCGLVHPNVLRMGGLDPDQWQGWAFGLGLSRLVMMRYGVGDIRLLLGGDARFVEPFAPGA